MYLWSELQYRIMTLSQFLYREFVNSHFLSSLQFFHFIDISNTSISKCFFSLSQLILREVGPCSLRDSSFPQFTLSSSKRFEWACRWNSRMRVLRVSTLHSCFKISDFSLLRVNDLFVVQGLISKVLPDQRTWIKFQLFLEPLHVPRKCSLCRKMHLDSTFFLCVRSLRQVSLHFHGNEMTWTLSFLRRSDKLVIGWHLLLSPWSAAMNPAYSELDNCPNPIQEGVSQCYLLYH